MGLHEVVVDAEEAFDAVEGSYFLHCVLVTLGVCLFLGPISAEVEEGEAAVEEVRHGSVFGLVAAAGVLRGTRAASDVRELSKAFWLAVALGLTASQRWYLVAVWSELAVSRAAALASDAARANFATAFRRLVVEYASS